MTDAHGNEPQSDAFMQLDRDTWVLRDQIDTMRIYQKIAGRDVLPVYVSSTMDCGAPDYRDWVAAIEGRPYGEVCAMLKGVSG